LGEVCSMTENRPCILIADDDEDIRAIWSRHLAGHGYEVHTADCGETALGVATAHPIALALVNVVMPEPSGISLMARLKELRPETEVIIVTGYGSVDKAAEAMSHGAFYYLIKPLGLDQILAIVRDAWEAYQAKKRIQADDLVIDQENRQVTLRGNPVSLTCQEYELLVVLARHQGHVVSYDQLWREVWEYEGPPDRGVIQRAVSRLREEIGADRIIGIRGEGYCLH